MTPTPVGPAPGLGDEFLESVFERAPLGIVLLDSSLQIIRANGAFAHFLGSSPERLTGCSFWQGIHPHDRERGREALRPVGNREGTWVTMQLRCLHPDGHERWGEFTTSTLRSAKGEFPSAFSIVRDVTDGVAAESALRDSEMRNWRISESNMMALFEWRDAVTISEANDAFLQMLGYTREDLRAGAILWSDIVPADQHELSARLRDQVLSTGRIRPTRMDYRSRTGDRIPVLAGAARISWEPARGIGFALDMTEQRRIEDERAQAETALRQNLTELEQAQMHLQLADRMSSMGTLAAGVAHEINNPLGFLVANLGFAQEELSALRAHPLAPEVAERLTALTRALGEAQEGASRVRNIVLDLRTFSRPHSEMTGLVDVRRVLDSVVNMAKAEMAGRARVVRIFHEVPPVLGNEARLSHLFLNLVVNAAQSIPKPTDQPSGVTDQNQSLHEIRLTVEQTATGAVQVSIADTGHGIAPEHLSRIFDPFFTVNPVGRGTGLGLSICHEIVESLGGQINVSSLSGVGTTFRVVLPAAATADRVSATVAAVQAVQAEQTPITTSTAVPASPGIARILVVDDEPLMGSAIARVLASYDVTVLTSARTAISRLAAGERFDVILCDVMMPDFSGIDLYDAIANVAPDLLARMIFVTGGAYTPAAIDFLERVPNARLEKPLMPQVLQSAVATMMQTMGMALRAAPA